VRQDFLGPDLAGLVWRQAERGQVGKDIGGVACP
jgi:hypothetical protein